MNDKAEPKRPERTFQVLIDRDRYVLSNPTPTGRELLELAGKNPPSQFNLYLKVPGSPQPKLIPLDEKVDLTDPGVEKFVTLPLDQTEGEGRRHFSLPEDDMAWLQSMGLPYELVQEGGLLAVLLHEFPVPPGYNVGSVTAQVRPQAGYPDVQLDMVWFSPELRLVSGRGINAVSIEAFDGKPWQRWSRHRSGVNPWRPGIDNLATHYALVGEWLRRET